VTWKAATDKVLVFVGEQSKTTAGGLVLPDKMKTTMSKGKVIAAGPRASNVKAGDIVYFLEAGAVPVETQQGVGILFSMNVDYIMAGQREEDTGGL
jgi:co-chaperonin GroES (HSP10)